MLAFVIRRVLQALIVLVIVGLVAFMMFQFVGDPIEGMLGRERTEDDVDRLRRILGIDQPIIVQYGRFVMRVITGDFGISYEQGRSVADIIADLDQALNSAG